MIQVRNGVFETNSSSTHSICIQKKPVDADYGRIVFNVGEYGWDERTVNLGDYLYTAILCLDPENKRGFLSRLKSVLDRHHIRYELEKPPYDERWCSYDGCYIDHYDETEEFVEAMLEDEDMLLRGLFGSDSAVYTGNDNTLYDDDEMCDVACEHAFVKDSNGQWGFKKVGNWGHPYYDPDNYDYFYKGN